MLEMGVVLACKNQAKSYVLSYARSTQLSPQGFEDPIVVLQGRIQAFFWMSFGWLARSPDFRAFTIQVWADG